nr:MAG TPA: hypothetical protein [Bacteriophage sp.]
MEFERCAVDILSLSHLTSLYTCARYIAQKEAAYEAHLLHHLPLLRRTP